MSLEICYLGSRAVEQSRHEGRTEGKIVNYAVDAPTWSDRPGLQSSTGVSATALDELGEALLDFSDEAALATWLYSVSLSNLKSQI